MQEMDVFDLKQATQYCVSNLDKTSKNTLINGNNLGTNDIILTHIDIDYHAYIEGRTVQA